MLYISYQQDGEAKKIGPFFTVSPDGYDILSHNWIAYSVQTISLQFERIIVPTYHTISH